MWSFLQHHDKKHKESKWAQMLEEHVQKFVSSAALPRFDLSWPVALVSEHTAGSTRQMWNTTGRLPNVLSLNRSLYSSSFSVSCWVRACTSGAKVTWSTPILSLRPRPVHNLELQQTTRKVHVRCTKGLSNVTTTDNEICFLVKVDLSSRVRLL